MRHPFGKAGVAHLDRYEAICTLLEKHGDGLRAEELAAMLQQDEATVRRTLRMQAKLGYLVDLGDRGWWRSWVSTNAAIAWYQQLRKVVQRPVDFTLDELVSSSRRAQVLTAHKRAGVLAGVQQLQRGEVHCPKCGDQGRHATNHQHHVGMLAFRCRKCDHVFRATELKPA